MNNEKENKNREPKKKPPRRKSLLTRNQKILVGVAIALTVTLVTTLAYQSVFVKPKLTQKDPASSSVEEVDYGEGTRPRSDGQRKSKDFYTILVMGRDTGGGGNTDTMMLAGYDVTNQKLTVMNIPRDTMVNIPWDIKRINAVYNYNGGEGKGVKAVFKEVAQLVGFEPDYQIIVEWEAVGKLVDAIGGVEFDVPRNMNYEDPYQDLSIHIEKGFQKLNGEQAMGVIRYRHDNRRNGKTLGYPDGDLGRIKTQQAFLKAVIQQLLQVKNVSKINQFSKIFEENVETDLSVQNLFWFGKSAVLGGLNMENVNFITMPNTPKTCYSRVYGNYQSYVVPNANELLELVNGSLSPFVDRSTLGDLDIMSINSDGSISSTTGHVEDGKAATPPVIPSNTPTEPVDNEAGETEIDPITGLPVVPPTGEIDPITGLPVVPPTGEIDPITGLPVVPPTGEIDPATGLPEVPPTGGIDPVTGFPYASPEDTVAPPTDTVTPVVPVEPTEIPAGDGGTVLE